MNTVKGESVITMIPIYRIKGKAVSRGYSRRDLSSLAKSIEKNGVLDPIIVRSCGKSSYQLVTGERRLRAAVMTGLTVVPCIILHCNERQAAVYSLLENIQREPPDHFKRAEAFSMLVNEFGFTPERLAVQLGITCSCVKDHLNILDYTEGERRIIEESGISFERAAELIRVNDASKRYELLRQLADDTLSEKERTRFIGGSVHKLILKDLRLFYNTINNAVLTMRKAGIDALLESTENSGFIEYRIKIAKTK